MWDEAARAEQRGEGWGSGDRKGEGVYWGKRAVRVLWFFENLPGGLMRHFLHEV